MDTRNLSQAIHDQMADFAALFCRPCIDRDRCVRTTVHLVEWRSQSTYDHNGRNDNSEHLLDCAWSDRESANQQDFRIH